MTTLTVKNSMSVAFPVVTEGRLVDVYFRMLKPDELKLATGFPKDYVIQGNTTEQVKQIGNAVPVNTAREFCIAALSA
jgi:DNA (cytosine-5)-methyltransferase 1